MAEESDDECKRVLAAVLANIRELDTKRQASSSKNQRELWSVSAEVGEILELLVQLVNPDNILELGTSAGYSTLCLCRASSPSTRITTVERDPEFVELAEVHFQRAAMSARITQVCDEIARFLERDSSNFDFVFLDADKPMYKDYFLLLRSRIAKGGLLVADNILSHAGQVGAFIAAVESDNDFRVCRWNHSSGLLIARKVI